MKIKHRMKATSGLVVVLLTAGMLEPAAFGKDPESAQAQGAVVERAAEQVSPSQLPSRPAIMVAQATPPVTQPPTVAQRSILPPTAPARQQSNGKSKKWIWILAGAGAAGVTAALLARGDNPPPPPAAATITIGAPTVSQPQ
jgi:hypothetical protein